MKRSHFWQCVFFVHANEFIWLLIVILNLIQKNRIKLLKLRQDIIEFNRIINKRFIMQECPLVYDEIVLFFVEDVLLVQICF